jgi:hypothetical protein
MPGTMGTVLDSRLVTETGEDENHGMARHLPPLLASSWKTPNGNHERSSVRNHSSGRPRLRMSSEGPGETCSGVDLPSPVVEDSFTLIPPAVSTPGVASPTAILVRTLPIRCLHAHPHTTALPSRIACMPRTNALCFLAVTLSRSKLSSRFEKNRWCRDLWITLCTDRVLGAKLVAIPALSRDTSAGQNWRVIPQGGSSFFWL